MLEGLGERPAVGGGIVVALIPPLSQLFAHVEVVDGDHPGIPVREGLHKAVDVVALGLELLALEVGQSVDLIEVVVGVAVGSEGEAAGVEGFQLLHGLVGEAADHQELALPAAVGDDALQNGADVAAAGGVEVLVHAPVDEALAEIALHLGHLAIV